MTFTRLIWKIERFIIRPKCEKCSAFKEVENPEKTTQTHECPIMGYVQPWSNCMYYEKSKVLVQGKSGTKVQQD